MKYVPEFLLLFLLISVCTIACKPDSAMLPDPTTTNADTSLTATAGNQLRIRVGQRTFTATLLTNATATAFKARLPLTITMRELNDNEKYSELTPHLPASATTSGAIQSGDLMLYGASTLVLFYETFRTTYSYSRIGRIDNPSGLAAALGTGSVTVTFELTN